jgi:hypothetical protein
VKSLHQRQLGPVAAHVAEPRGGGSANAGPWIRQSPAATIDGTGGLEVLRDGDPRGPGHHRCQPAERIRQGDLERLGHPARGSAVEQIEGDRLSRSQRRVGR